MQKIIVLTGGSSSERDISLRTAETIESALSELDADYTVADVANDAWKKSLQGAIAIVALHGHFGEDGTLQNILENHKVPFTGSGSRASKVAFDKNASKDVARRIGLNCPNDINPNGGNLPTFPVVVKPAREGSSYGITIVGNSSELETAVSSAKGYDEHVIIEEYIEGRELSCAVTQMEGQAKALPVVEIIPKAKYFDYRSKYSAGGATEIAPAKISDTATQQIQKLSEDIFNTLGLRQYARIDWILKGETPYFLEVNTLPGMTKTSLINKELSAAGISTADFIKYLIDTASY